jgi:hypothetical protein
MVNIMFLLILHLHLKTNTLSCSDFTTYGKFKPTTIKIQNHEIFKKGTQNP